MQIRPFLHAFIFYLKIKWMNPDPLIARCRDAPPCFPSHLYLAQKENEQRTNFDIFHITLLLTLCLAVQAMSTRILGIGLVCMVHPNSASRGHRIHNNNHNNEDSNKSNSNTITSTPKSTVLKKVYYGVSNKSARMHWDYKIQSHVVAAHDWGELALLPVAGILINSRNLHNVLSISVCLGVVFTALFPVSAIRYDAPGAFVGRFALGLSHAFSAPSIDASVAEFIPEKYKNTLYSVVLSGNQVASLSVNLIAAYYCHSDLLGGWPVGFYFVSFLGILWVIVWIFCGKKFSSNSNATYSCNRKYSVTKSNTISMKSKYKELFSSPALWALLPCNVASIWTTRLLMYYVPSFFRDVLHLSLMENGVYSSLPFITLCFGKIVFSAMASRLVALNICSKNGVSKFFNCVGFVGSGTLLLSCSLRSTISSTAVLGYVTAAGALFSATSPGFRWSVISLNRRYAALVSSVCTTASMIGAIAFPYMVGMLVKRGTKKEWRSVFAVVVLVDVTAALIYCMFGSVEQTNNGIKSLEENGQTGDKQQLLPNQSDSDA